MAIYTVHEPPLKKNETEPDPDRFVFVRDGFYFWAFLFGPLWMLRHRLWLVLLCYVLIAGALAIILRTVGASANVGMAVGFLVAVLVGLRGRHACGASRWRAAAAAPSGWWSATTGTAPSGASSRAGSTARGSDHDPAAGAAERAAGAAGREHGAAPAPGRRRRDRPVSAAGSVAVTVAIVDYGSGNLHSAAKAFERAAREEGLDQAIVVTSDPDRVRAGRSRGAAGRRRLRRLPARPRCGPRHGRRR